MKRLYPNLASGFIILFLLLLASESWGQISTFTSNVASGNWNVAGSWSAVGGDPDGIPDSDDIVIILSGHNISLNGAQAADDVTVNSGGTLTATGGSLTITTTMSVDGTYIHAIDGGVIPPATWTATSDIFITGVTGTAPSGFSGQDFGNFTWNSPGQTINAYLEASFDVQGDFEVLDTGLPIVPGSRALRMSPDASSYTINVDGNFLVDNSTFKMNNNSGNCFLNVTGDVTIDNSGFLTLCTGSAGSSSTLTVTGDVDVLSGTLLMQEDNQAGAVGTLDVNGDLTIAPGATITETEINGTGSILFTGAGTQTFTNGGTMSNQIDVTVNPGVTLQMGDPTSIFDGTGTFLLSAGSTLGVTSADGITTAGALGNVQVSGTRTYTAGASYIYNGSADQNVGNGLTQNSPADITFNNPGNTVSLGAATSLTGNMVVTAGTLDTNSQTVSGTGTFLLSAGTTLEVTSADGITTAGATGNIQVSGTRTYTSGANYVYNGGIAQDVGNGLTQNTPANIEIDNGAATVSLGALTGITSDIILTSGTLDANGQNISLDGDWTNNGGSFTGGVGTVTFDGGGAQSIGGTTSTTFNDVVIDGTSSTSTTVATTIGGNLNIDDGTSFSIGGFNFSVGGTTTVGGGVSGNLTFLSTAGTKTFTDLVTIAAGGTWDNSINSTVNFQGGITNNATGTFTAGTGLHTFNTNPQALTGTLSIPNVTVTGVTLTNNDDLTVATSLSGTGGLTQGGTATLDLGGTSAITTLTATAGTNIVTFSGAAQTVNNNNYVTLELSGSGIKTLQAGTSTISGNLTLAGTASSTAVTGLTIGGNVTIGAGTSLTAGAFSHNVAGDWTNNGGTFTVAPGAGTITFNGGGAQAINGSAATQTFNNVTVNKGGASTLSVGGSTTTINVANLNLSSGSFTAPLNTNISGNFTNNGTTFTAGAGTVTLNGTGLQLIGGGTPTTFNNLTTANSTNSFVLGPASRTVGSNLTIADGTAFTISTINFSVGGLTLVGTGTSGLLEITNAGAAKTFTGLVTVSSGATWDNSGDAPVIFQGGITNSGTFTAGNGVHTFNTNPQALTGALSLPSTTVDAIALTNNNSLIVRSTLNGTGDLVQAAAATLDLRGSVSITTLTASNAGNTVLYSGSSQTVKAIDYQNLTINQSSGEAVLEGSTTVNGVLDLSARNLNLGGFNLILESAATISVVGPSASKMIITGGGGTVRKIFAADGAFTFPIGENSGMPEYSPVTLNASGTGYGIGAYLSASVMDAKHPDNASGTNFLTRYWEIEPSGITAPVVDVTATYVAADISGIEANIDAAQLDGTFNQTTNPWAKYAILGGNTLTAGSAGLTDGQISAFTGITGADPSISIDFGPTVELCEGSTVVLNTTLVGGDTPILYSWSPTTDLSASTVANPTFTGNTPGVTVYTVTVYDGNGIIATDNISITVTDAPTADAGLADEVCEDTSYTVSDAAVTNSAGILWTHDGSGTITGGTETTLTPQYNPVAADGGNVVTLTLTVSGNGSCADAVDTKALTVTDAPTADAGLADEVCEDTPYTVADAAVTNSAGILWTHDGSGTLTNATTTTPTYTPVAADGGSIVTLTLTVSGNGSCADAVDTKALTVTDAPTADAGLADEVCEDTSYTVSDAAVTNSAGILWTHDGSGTITGGTETTLTPQYNPVAADGGNVVTLTLTVSGNGSCADAVDTKALTVTDAPTADAGLADEVCEDTPYTVADAAVTNSAGIIWTHDGSGTLTNATTTTPTYTPVAADGGSIVTLTLTVSGNGSCADAVDTKALTVTDAPTADAGLADEVCEDTSYTVSDAAVTNSAGILWTHDGSGTITGGTETTLTPQYNPVAADGGNVVTLTLTVSGNGSCADAVDTKALTVTDAPTADAGLADEVCEDTPYTVADAAVTNSAGILWTHDGSGTLTNATTTTPTYTPVAADGGSIVTLTLTVSGNGSCADAVDTKALTVTDAPTADAGLADEVCEDTSYTVSDAAVTNSAGILWTHDGSGTITGGTETTLTPQYNPVAADGGNVVTLTLTVSGNGSCADAVDTKALTVTDAPTADAGLADEVCEDTPYTVADAAVTNSAGIIWTHDGSGTLTNATTTTPTYTPVAADGGSIVTLTLTVSGNGSCADAVDTKALTVTDAPTADAGLADEVCEDTSYTVSDAAVTNSAGILWTHDGSGTITGGTETTLTPQYNPVAADGGNVVTLTLTVSGNGSCADAVDTKALTVTDAPTADAGLADEVCEDTPYTVADAAVTNSAGILWTHDGSGTLTNATTTTPTYTPVAADGGSIVTLTLTVSGNGSCADAVDTKALTVTDAPTADAGLADEVCEDTSYTVSDAAVTNSAGILWTHDGSGTITGGTETTLTPQYNPVAADGGTVVTLTLTVSGNGSCADAVDTKALTVTDAPTADAGLADEVCEDTPYTVADAAVTNSAGILWTHDGSGTLTNATTTTPTYTPVAADGGSIVTLTLTVSGNGSCADAVDTKALTVTDAPTADAGLADEVCEDTSYTVSDAAVTNSAGILWTHDGSGTITGGTETTLTPQYNPVAADGGNVVTLTLTVSGNGSCADAVDTKALTVTDAPTADAGLADEVCEDTPYTVADAAVTNSAGILWTHDGSGTLTNATTTTPTYTPVAADGGSIVTLTLTVSGNGSCADAVDTKALTVTDAPTADAGLADEVCEDTSYTVSDAAVTNSAGILWTHDGSGTITGGTETTLTPQYNPVAADGGTVVTLTLTVSGNGSCADAVDTKALTVTDAPTADAGLADEVCEDTPYTVADAAVTNSAGILWTHDGSGTLTNATTTTPTYTPVAADGGSIVTLTLTVSGNGSCADAVDTKALTVTDAPTADAGLADEVCEDTSYTVSDAAVTNSAGILWTHDGSGTITGGTETTLTPQYNPVAADGGTVVTLTLTVSGNGSCADAVDTKALTVTDAPTADAGLADEVCEDTPYTVADAAVTNSAGILWTHDGSGTLTNATTTTPTYTPVAADGGSIVTLTLTVSGNGSCADAVDTKALTVTDAPTADAGLADEVCEDTSYTVSDAAVTNSAGILWTHDGSGTITGGTETTLTPQYNPVAADGGNVVTLTLTVSGNGSCADAVDTKALTVTDAPTADAGLADEVCEDTPYTVADAAVTNSAGIIWTHDGSGTLTNATTTTPTYTPVAADGGSIVTLTLTVSGNGSCADAVDTKALTVTDAPTADAGLADEVCEDTSYTVSDAAVTNSAGILWTHDGSGTITGGTETTLTPQYNPVAADGGTVVTLTLTVSGNGSCADAVDTKALTVTDAPTADAGLADEVCEDTPYTVADAAVTNSAGILWTHDGSGTLTNATTTTPTYTPVAADGGSIVTLTLTVSGNGSCADAVDTKALTVTDAPTADAGLADEVCEDTSYTVSDAAVTNSAGILWTHDGSGTITGGTETTLTPQYNPVAADGGNVVTLTLTVSGNGSCADAVDTKALTVTDAPTADAGLADEVCEDTPYTVADAAVTNSAGILWTHDGSGTLANATTTTPTYTPVAADGGSIVTLTLTVSGNGSCADAVDTKALTVTDAPTADAGLADEVCEDTSYTVSDAAVTNSAGILWTHDGSGTITGGTETTLTPQYNPVAADGGNVVTLTLTVSGNGSCADAVDTKALTVTDAPTADAGLADEVCEDTPYTVADAAVTNSAGIIWTHDGSGTLTNATTTTPTYTPVAADGGSIVTLTLTVSGNGSCADAVDTKALTVTDAPTADAGLADEVCEDTSYTVSDAAVTNSAGILWTHDGSGTITGGTETTLTPQYNPVAADGGNVVTLTLTVSGNGSCADAVDTKALTVTDAPTADAGLADEVCEDTPYTVADAAVTNSAGILWTHDGSGTLANATTTTPTYTPVAADGGSIVTLTLTVSGNGSCADAVDTKALTVTDAPTADAGLADEVCEDTSYTVSDAAVTNSAGILWTHDGSGTITGGTETTLTPQYNPVAADGGTVVTLTLTVSGNGSCADAVDTKALTVTDAPTADAGLADEVCEDTPYTVADAAVTNSAGILWTHDGSGTLTNATTTTPTYTPVAADGGSIVTLTLTVSGNGSCADAVDTKALTVTDAPTADAGLADEVCEDTSYTVSDAAVTNSAGILWTHDGSGTITGGTETTLTPQYNPVAADGGNVVTLTLTVSGNGSCADAVDTKALTVTDAPTADAGLADEVCEDTPYTVADAAVTNSAGIIWTHDGSGTLTNATTTTPTYTPVAADGGSIVTLTLTVSGNGSCADAVDTKALTVTDAPTADAGLADEVCEDTSYTVSDAAVTNSAGILWTHDGSGTITGGTETTLTPQYNPVAADGGTVVTLTLTVSGNGSCADAVDTKALTVTDAPTADAGLADEVCEDTPYTVADAAVTNSAGILWTHDGSGTLANATTTTPTYTPVAADGGSIVTLTLTVSGNGSCADAVDTKALTVTDAPTADAGLADEVCEDTSYTVSDAAVTNSAGILWTHDGSGTITGGTETTLTPQYNPVAADGGTVVTLTLTVSGNGSCADAVDTKALTVTDAPTADAGLADEVCEDTPYTVADAAVTNSAGILWTHDGSGTLTNATTTTPTYTPVAADGGSIVTLTLTVSGNGSCADAVDTKALTVTDAPTADAGLADEVCEDTSYTVSDAAVTNSAGILWTHDGSGTITGGTETTLTPQYNPVAADGGNVVTLTLTVSGNGSCADAVDTKALTVTDAPTADAGLADEVCEDTPYTVADAAVTNSAGILWTHDGSGTLTNATTTTPTYTPVAADGGSIVTLTLTVSGNGSCADAVDTKALTVTDAPTADAGLADEVCEDTSYTVSDAAVTNSAGILWTHDGSGTITGGTETTLTPQYNPVAADGGTVVTLTLTVSGNGSCADAVDTKALTVTDAPTADAGLADEVCEDTPYTVADAAVTNSAGILWTHDGSGTLTNATTTTPTYTPVAADGGSIVTLTLTVSGNGSCADAVDTKALTVTDAPTADAGLADEVCEDTSYTVSDAAVTNSAGILWTHDGSGTITGGTETTLTPQYNPVAADGGTVVTLTLTVSGNGSCADAVDTKALTIKLVPNVNNAADQDICSGDAVNFTPTGDVIGTVFNWTAVLQSGTVSGFTASGVGTIGDVLVNGGAGVGVIRYTITPTADGCIGTSVIVDANVEPTPGVTSSGDETICESSGNTTIDLTAAVTPSAGSVVYDYSSVASSGLVGGFTSGSGVAIIGPADITDPLTSSSNNIESVTYTITPRIIGSLAGNCIGTPFDVVVTVYPSPSMTVTNNTTPICSNELTDIDIATPTQNGIVTITNITKSDPSLSGNSPISSTWLNGSKITDLLINPTNNIQTIDYEFTVNANGCPGPVITRTVTINPNPVWTVDDTGVTEICEGQLTNIDLNSLTQNGVITLTNVTTSVPFDVGMGGWTPIGTMFNFNPPAGIQTITDGLTNSNPGAETVTYTFDILANGCSDPISRQVVITVNPGPIFSITNSLPTVCSGDPTSVQLNSPTTGAIIKLITINDAGGTISGYPPVNSLYSDGNTITNPLTNSTNTLQTLEYVFEVSAAGCTNVSTQNTFIDVKPDPSIGWTVTNNDVSICEGEMTDIDLFSPTDFAVITITNVIPSDPGVGGFSPIGTTFNFNPTIPPSKITDALTNSTSIAQTVQYVFNITATGCSDPITKSTTVTIIPSPTFTINNTMPTICSNDMTSITLNSVNPGAIIELVGLTKTDPGVIGHDIVGNTYFPLPETITNTLLNPTNAPQDVVYEFRVSLAGCVNSVTQFATVTVNPSPTWAVTNNATTICEGQMTDIDLTSPTVGALVTIASISNPSGFISNFTPVSTVLPPLDFTLQDALLNSDVNPQSITYEFTIQAAGCTDPVSKFATVTVNPTPTFTITNPAPTDNICSGDLTNILLNTPVSGGLVEITAVSPGLVTGTSPVGATFSDGAVLADLLINPTNNIETVDYTFIATAPGCPSSAPQMTTVTVNPDPSMTVTNNLSTLCEGTATDIDLTSPTQNGIVTLSSVTTSDPGLTGFTPAGATYGVFGPGPEIFDVLSNSTQSPQTIIYSFNVDANGCSNPVSQQVVVTVNPIPTFTVTNPSPTDEICSDQTTLIQLNTLTQNGIIRIDNITLSDITVTGFSPIGSTFLDGSVITDKLTNPTDNPQTVDYTFKVSANGCIEPATITTTVTVYPNPVWTVTNNDLEICVGETTDIDLFSPTAAAIITLDNVTTSDPSVTGFTVPTSTFAAPFATPTIFDALTNGTNSPQTISYEFSIDANGCSDPLTKVVMVTINPTPTYTITNNLSIICSEATTDIDIASPTTNALITLTNVVPSSANVIGFSSIGTTYLNGSTISDILVNTGSAIETVDYTFSVNANGCPGASVITRTVTVNPEPDVSASQNVQTICDMDFTNIILSNPNGVTGTDFSWTVSQSAGITGGTASSGGVINQQLFNSTNMPGSATYIVTPDANGCNGDPITVIITINPTPTIATSGNETICSPGLTSISITNPNSVAGTTFSWTVLSVTNGILGANSGAGSLISQTLINPNNTISGIVTYRITPSANGCNGPFTDVSVTVNPPAVVDAGLDFDICADGTANLSGSFGGASTSITWSGYGGTISSASDPLATYTPSAAEVSAGSATLTISSNDPDGGGPCPVASDNVTITINPLPIVNIISPVDNQYAQSDLPQNLIADQVSPPGVWTGLGVLGGFYVPSAVIIPPGDSFVLDNLVYTYTDLNGCVNSDSKIIRVDEIPDIEFATKPGQDYCENQGLVDLFDDLNPNITTGLWNGPGIIDGINGIFDPDFATVNTHIVTYTVTDPLTGGISIAPVTIRVHPKPIVNFDIGTLCAEDSVQFTDLSTVVNVFPEDTIVKWEWNFNNERFEKDQNPMMFFRDPGMKSVSLSVKTLATSDGCVADTTFTDIYGKVPIVDFDWSNICFQDTTRFIELAELEPGSLDTESNYTWDFGDGNSVSGPPGVPFSITHPDGAITFSTVGYETPSHEYVNASTGDFFGAELFVQTSSGCIENLPKTVEILPSESLSLTGGAYIADFNSDESGWFDDPEFEGDTSSWLWDGGQGFWWTGDNIIPTENWTYLNNENSVVNGPCFDFTGINRPMVALDYWVDNEDGKDGIVFEYSIDGFEWFVVGEADGSGINWYNDDGIVSRPGFNNGFNNVSNAGWTTNDNAIIPDGYLQWKNARYTLPEDIIGLNKIRIRFHFASNADNENVLMRGFGFDNVFIGEKQKTVLLENFASLNDYPDYQLFQNKINNLRTNLLDDDVIYINYHISANDPDTLNQDNPDVPRIRSNKYGISNPIHSIIDGSSEIDFGFSGRYQDPELNEEGVDSRSLITPPLTIDNVTVLTTAGNEIEVQWSIRALEDIDRPIRIYTGIFEKNFVLNDPGAIYDGDMLYNTMKQMLPSTNGMVWNQPWVNGQTAGIASFLDANGFTGETSLIWDINENFVPIHSPDSLAVVVFIQDEETNEIYQAAVQHVIDPKQGVEPLALEDELIGELDNITIYPNPVLDDMHFILEDALKLSREDFYWKIIDQRGLTMLEGDLLFRNGRITIDTKDIPNGLYHLVMGIESKPLIYRKIAIMHR